MGKYDKRWLGNADGPWELPDEEKISYVRENYASELTGAEDNRYLIDLFDIFEKKRKEARKLEIEKLANKNFGITQDNPLPPSSANPLIA